MPPDAAARPGPQRGPGDSAPGGPGGTLSVGAQGHPGLPAAAAERVWERLEAWGERLNPILVKEVRQALRSRRFIVAFMLALVASLAATLLVLVSSDFDAEAGKPVFTALFVCTTVIAMVVVPFEVQARHQADKAHASVDLVQITRLSAYRILSGKLQAAGVTLVLYLSALVPFSTFSYLLRGVTPAMIAIGLFFTLAAGLTAINFVLFVTTFVGERRSAGAAMLFCLFGSFGVMGLGISLIEASSRGLTSPDDLWAVLGLAAAGTVALNAILFTTTVSRLSFASANKETGPRLALLGANLYLVGLIFSSWALSNYDDDVLLGVSIAALAWWGAVGYFVLAVPIDINERVRRSSPRLSLAGYLLWPGRGRAYAFYLLNLALLCLPAATVLPGRTAWDKDLTYALISVALYVASFPGIPAALFASTRRRWGWPTDLTKATGLFILCYYVALHLVLWITVVTVVEVSGGRAGDLAPLHALSPPVGVGFIFGAEDEGMQMFWNSVVAIVALVITFNHFAPLAARDLVASFRLAAARRRGEFDDPSGPGRASKEALAPEDSTAPGRKE